MKVFNAAHAMISIKSVHGEVVEALAKSYRVFEASGVMFEIVLNSSTAILNLDTRSKGFWSQVDIPDGD